MSSEIGTCAETSGTSIPKSKTVSVTCGREIVKFQVRPWDFRFHDFDCWVRSRFCIASAEQLIYKSSDGVECMPGANFFQEEEYIQIERNPVEELQSTSFEGSAVKRAAKEACGEEEHNTFLLVFIAATAIYLYSQGVVSLSTLTAWCDSVEDKMISMGFFSKKGVALESFVSCICWSVPYLFIRRMCNPETSKTALRKYSADAVFGGLAAGVTVLLKSIIVSTMNR